MRLRLNVWCTYTVKVQRTTYLGLGQEMGGLSNLLIPLIPPLTHPPREICCQTEVLWHDDLSRYMILKDLVIPLAFAFSAHARILIPPVGITVQRNLHSAA